MRQIRRVAGAQVIDANHRRALRQQRIAEVRAKKSRSPRHQNPLCHLFLSKFTNRTVRQGVYEVARLPTRTGFACGRPTLR